MDFIEEKVTELFSLQGETPGMTNITEVLNKSIAMENEAEINKEKLKGRFIIHLNSKVPMKQQIEKYANEPVAFHLHKTRNFFERLKTNLAHVTSSEKVEKLREKVHKQTLADEKEAKDAAKRAAALELKKKKNNVVKIDRSNCIGSNRGMRSSINMLTSRSSQ